MSLLEVQGLSVGFSGDSGFTQVVEGVEFHLEKGEILGIVGESGSGKTLTALSILRLLPKPAGKITGGQILYQGKNLVDLAATDMHKIRGGDIAMIFQEPMTALNPVRTVGGQLAEVFRLHVPEMKKSEIKKKCISLLEQVGIPEAAHRLQDYPHNLSGGMRQRVMIAMALAGQPSILIADEPTTALDVTIQAQILQLIKDLQVQNNMAVIFVTHDLGVIAELCDRVVVLYAGEVVESASIHSLFTNPQHPYTQGLLASIPRMDDEPKTTLQTIEGMVPAPHEYSKGCRFYNRCQRRTDKCNNEQPLLEPTAEHHQVRCFHWDKS